jgi:hypothetical protein
MIHFKSEDLKIIQNSAVNLGWERVENSDPNILIFEKLQNLKKNDRITIWAKKGKPTFTLGTTFKTQNGTREQKFYWNVKTGEIETYLKKK